MPIAPKKAAPAPAAPPPTKGSYFAGVENTKAFAARNYVKPGTYRVQITEVGIYESEDKITWFYVKPKVLELLSEDSKGRVGETFDIAMDLTTTMKGGFCYGMKDSKLFGAAIAPEEIDPNEIDAEYLDGVLEHDFEKDPVECVLTGVPVVNEDGTPKTDKKGRALVNAQWSWLG